MINKKINRLLGAILGVVLIIGVTEMPALAEDSVQATLDYTTNNTNFTEDKNYIVSKNNSIEVNGLKISIDKIVATKHKLEGTIIVESQKSIDEIKGRNIITNLTYGQNEYNSEGMSYHNVDEKTLRIDIRREVNDEELPKKGELRIDIVIPSYKVNVGLDVNVDFSESFKNIIEKDISQKVPEFGITLNKLESNIMGTTIVYSQPVADYTENMESGSLDFSFILKAGDKMYKVRPESYSSTNNGDELLEMGSYIAEGATYEKVKDEKAINIIPIVCNMTWDDIRKIYDENFLEEYNKKREENKETTNNVSYVKYFDFSDGSKGEIYNIERNDNGLKVYCRGTSETESLLMASNMFMYYNIGKDKLVYTGMYENSGDISFYKDSKDAFGYIVEFNNLEKDKLVEVDFDNVIKEIDKFEIGNEIHVSK